MRLPGLFTALMQMSFDAALDGNDEALAMCEDLEGAVIAIELTEFGAPLYLRPRSGGIDVMNAWEGAPDVSLRGTVPALLMANFQRGKGIPKGIRIDGNAETGQRFQKLLQLLNIDWEERLSKFAGDTAAHRIGRFFRGSREFAKQSAERISDNLREYLQEESEDLPRRREIEEFLNAVDALRSDADRVEARLQRLFRRASQAGVDVTR